MALVLALAALVWAAPARASAPPSPWDGINPFHCTIQNAGFGTKVPDPGADPYCVAFDKTHQNITQLGLLDFLLKEPARVAAADAEVLLLPGGPLARLGRPVGRRALCSTSSYGHYFFNKATGDGGAGSGLQRRTASTFDPTSLPGFPPAYGRTSGRAPAA